MQQEHAQNALPSPRRIVLVRSDMDDPRLRAMLETAFTQLGQRTGATVEFFGPPPSRGQRNWRAAEQVRDDYARRLPETLGAPPPDILFLTENRVFPPRDRLPGTCLLGLHDIRSPITQALDGQFLSTFRLQKMGPERPARMHLFPVTNCHFKRTLYENACTQVAAPAEKPRPVVALLVGELEHHRLQAAHVAKLARQSGVRVKLSCSSRLPYKDWLWVRKAFAGCDVEYFRQTPSTPPSANPYYRFLAEATSIVVLDSASMAAEAAHTGKPVYADMATINAYGLASYVHPFTNDTSRLDDTSLPPMDTAGGVADAVLAMYHDVQRQKQLAAMERPVGLIEKAQAGGRVSGPVAAQGMGR